MLITPLTRNALITVERCAEDLQTCTQQAQQVSEDIGKSTVAKLLQPRYILIVFASGLIVAQMLSKKPSPSHTKKSKARFFSTTQLFSYFVSIWVMLAKTRNAEKAVSEKPVKSEIRTQHS